MHTCRPGNVRLHVRELVTTYACICSMHVHNVQCTHACMYSSMMSGTYALMYECMYVSMYVCMYVCLYVCRYVCMFLVCMCLGVYAWMSACLPALHAMRACMHTIRHVWNLYGAMQCISLHDLLMCCIASLRIELLCIALHLTVCIAMHVCAQHDTAVVAPKNVALSISMLRTSNCNNNNNSNTHNRGEQ